MIVISDVWYEGIGPVRQEISAVEYFSEESYMNTSDLSDGNCYCRPNKSIGDSDDQNHNLFI